MLVFNESQKAALRPFIGLEDPDGNAIKAGKKYLLEFLAFRYSSGDERARHDKALAHQAALLKGYVRSDQIAALAHLFRELALDQYEAGEIKAAIKQFEKEEIAARTAVAS